MKQHRPDGVCDDGAAMRGGSLRSWSSLAVAALLGACSNIIGISSYEIDPTLGEGGDGSNSAGTASAGGSTHSGGKGSVIEAGAPAGGDDTGVAGTSTAGGSGAAGKSTGGSSATGTAGAGVGVGGDPTPSGCQTADDCDDTVDCTTDTCKAGVCAHAPKDTLCDASLCETCQAGIGCVAGDTTTTQLLLDPNFDLLTGDWDESGSDGTNVMTVSMAQSGTKAAKFGPAPADATEQDYSDLLQYVTIPKGTIALTLTGYYKLAPGTTLPSKDYLVAAFYEDGGTKPFTQFHSFAATSGVQTTWKMFSYTAPKADVLTMGGTEYTFDLVAHVWDTVFHIDSLQLNATLCK